MAYGFNAEGGSRNFSFSTRDTHSKLYESIAISRRRYPKDTFFLRAESFYNVASQVDDLENDGPPGFLQGFGGRSLHAQSHGESFLSLVQNRFRGQGLYLLDEPEAALSPSKILTLIAQIDYLVKNDSQFLIATHSPMLMAYPNAQIYVLSEQGIEETPYEQTEHYLLTKRFLNDPARMLRYLLEESEE